MAIYMKIDNVKGSVTTKGFQDTIQLYSIHQNGSRPVQHCVGMGNDREKGQLNFDCIHISKGYDSATITLYDYFCSAKTIPTVQIYQCIINNNPDWQIQYTLHNVLISNLSEYTTAEHTQENLSLAYTKIEKGYKQQSSNGQFSSPSYTGYDLAQGSKL